MATYEEVVNLAQRRSLFYPSSEIYQSTPAGLYDFGPYGAAIKRKIIEVWRKELVQKEDMLEIDGALIMPEDVFKASGHLASFDDPVTQCKKCNTIHRADKMLSEITKESYPERMPDGAYTDEIRKHNIKCPKCKGELGDVKRFNMMVKADLGILSKANCYLRPETCQSIFTNFSRMTKTMRMKLPKAIAQVGKSFRNEISPRQSIIRCVEFTQMEAEVFFDPDKINEIENFDDVAKHKINVLLTGQEKIETFTAEELVKKKIVSGKLIAYYLARTQQLFETLGVPFKSMRFREVAKDDRAFYSKETWDFEVETSIGWLELVANNYRTDYDLTGHAKISKQDLTFLDDTGKRFVPHVWEISIGTDRTFYCVIEHALKTEKKKENEERVWLALKPAIAPLNAAIFPLLSNKPEIVAKAKEVYAMLKGCYEVFYDGSGSVGKRYARMDEIGCPICITIDFDSLANDDVTIRDRDTTEQKRVKIEELPNALYQLITGVSFAKV